MNKSITGLAFAVSVTIASAVGPAAQSAPSARPRTTNSSPPVELARRQWVSSPDPSRYSAAEIQIYKHVFADAVARGESSVAASFAAHRALPLLGARAAR
jgi:hypothetical protein